MFIFSGLTRFSLNFIFPIKSKVCLLSAFWRDFCIVFKMSRKITETNCKDKRDEDHTISAHMLCGNRGYRLFRQLLHYFFTSLYHMPFPKCEFCEKSEKSFHFAKKIMRFTWYTQWCNQHGYAPTIKHHQYDIKSVRKVISFIP